MNKLIITNKYLAVYWAVRTLSSVIARWIPGFSNKVNKQILLVTTFLVISVQINFAQQSIESKPYALVKATSIDRRFESNKYELEAMPLVGRGSSYGYGGFVDDRAMVFNNEIVHYFLCSMNAVMYFNKDGDLIGDQHYSAPERPLIVSKNGKYILVSNRETRETRMKMFDGTVVWRREIPRLTIGAPALTPGRISDDGNLILEIAPCSRDYSGCATEKMVFIDTHGNATEIGDIMAGEIISRCFTSNISESGKFYAISCFRKIGERSLENVVALYDLDKRVELWRHTSQVPRCASTIFVTNDGQVATICGKNSSEREAFLCFFDFSGQIIRSHPKERIFFMSPDGKVLLTLNNETLSFFVTSTGERLGQYPQSRGFYVRSLSNNGLLGTRNNRLYTVRQNGEIISHNQEVEAGFFLDLVSKDGSDFLSVNWKKKMTKLYNKSKF